MINNKVKYLQKEIMVIIICQQVINYKIQNIFGMNIILMNLRILLNMHINGLI